MAVIPKNGVRHRNVPRGLSAEEIRRRQNPTWSSFGEEEYDPRSRAARAKQKARERVRSRFVGDEDELSRPTDRRLDVNADDLSLEEMLRRNVDRAGEILNERLGRSDILSKNDPKVRQAEIQREHRQYALMMIATMIAPMRERPKDASRTNAVLRSVGMGMGMWLTSPAFRKEVRGLPRTTLEMWDERVQEKIKLKVESKTNQGQRVGKFLQARYDRVMQAEQGGHAPFSDHSAALAVVFMNDELYDKSREPGADIAGLQQRYSETVKWIYQQAVRDGVDPVSIDANMRYVVGRRMALDPEYANRYSHTAYDQVRRSPLVEQEFTAEDGTTSREHVWDGTFQHRDGGTIKTSDPGYFSPRLPADPKEHVQYMSEAIASEFKGVEDVEDFHRVLTAWSSARLPSFQEGARELAEDGGSTYPLESVQRLDRMFACMEDDHYDANDQQQMFSYAFAGAVSDFREANPELVEEWAQEYGEEWEARFTEMVEDPATADRRFQEQRRAAREERVAAERAEREAQRQAAAEKARREAAKPREHGQREREQIGSESSTRHEQEAPFETREDHDVVEAEVEDAGVSASETSGAHEHEYQDDFSTEVEDAEVEDDEYEIEYEIEDEPEVVGAGHDMTEEPEYEEDFEDFAELGDDPYAHEQGRVAEAEAEAAGMGPDEVETEAMGGSTSGTSSASSKRTKTNPRAAREQAQRAERAQRAQDRAEKIHDGVGGDDDRARGQDRDAGSRSGSMRQGESRRAKPGIISGVNARQTRARTKAGLDAISQNRSKEGLLPVQEGIELTKAERMLAQRRAKATAKRTAGKKIETIAHTDAVEVSVDEKLREIEGKSTKQLNSSKVKQIGPSL